jgi:nicotinamidase-related amidase
MTLAEFDFKPDHCVVLAVDLQERLAAAMEPEAMEAVARKASIVLEAARLMGVPVVATEQYPRGLGPTLTPVREALGDLRPIEKTAFSCHRVAAVRDALAAHGPRTVVVLGMETHVCVWQTVRDLLRQGLPVAVLTDAVLSRAAADRRVGLRLAKQAGATLLSSETLLFDWLGDAASEHFKAVSRLVK